MTFTDEAIVEGWIAHSEAFEKAHAVDQFARYAPDVGWRAILAILSLSDPLRHIGDIARALGVLISKFGDLYISKIETEAANSPAFKACLASVTPNPTFPIPRHLWQKLSAASEVALGPMSPGMAKLYEDIPDLSHLSTVDLRPLDTFSVPQLSDVEILEYASDFFLYHDTFWAWEEVQSLTDKQPEAAWTIVLKIVEGGSDSVLCALGAGALEDLIEGYPDALISRVEARAAQDHRFRFCLSHVWRGSMAPYIWDRLVAARGSEPQRG